MRLDSGESDETDLLLGVARMAPKSSRVGSGVLIWGALCLAFHLVRVGAEGIAVRNWLGEGTRRAREGIVTIG